MGFADISAGDKIAKAKGARFIETDKGTFGFEVSFEFIEPSTGMPERLTWVGWLTDKAKTKTVETLVGVLGYNHSKEVDVNGILTDPNALDYSRDVKLVVEPEEYNGKTRMKIKWVNSLSGSSFAGIKPESIKSKLSAIGFDAEVLAIKKDIIVDKKSEEALPF